MAKMNLLYPVAAKLDETSGVPAYTAGVVLGEAMTANVSIETYSVPLYGDGRVAELKKGFKQGTVTLGTTEIGDKEAVYILGHRQEAATLEGAADEMELVATGSDDPPYVGFGFYGERIVGGVTRYRAVWLCKVKFSEPNDENETTGESPAWKTPSLEGTVMTDVTGVWKREITVDTPELAVKWLNDRAGIVTPAPEPDPAPGT